MKTGLILGKFMPLHLGHEFLVNTGLDNCDFLHVVVCSLSSEPIDGNLRYRWMRERFDKEVEEGRMKVHHLNEDWIPQEPSQCKSSNAFYATWAGIMKRFIGRHTIDIMFASEQYVHPVSLAISIIQDSHCEAYMVDFYREEFPVSGTDVRNDPFSHWNYINDEVKRYFTKKILVIGGESTGKSTLTANMAKHLRWNYKAKDVAEIQEYAREWIDKELDGDMERLTFDHITDFGVQQMRLVEDQVGKAKIIFSDTDAVVSMVFQDVYYGCVSTVIVDVADKEQWDLVLFLQPTVPWIDDGQRNLFNRRDEFTRKLKREMDKRRWNYVVIDSPDWEERIEEAKLAVEKIL